MIKINKNIKEFKIYIYWFLLWSIFFWTITIAAWSWTIWSLFNLINWNENWLTVNNEYRLNWANIEDWTITSYEIEYKTITEDNISDTYTPFNTHNLDWKDSTIILWDDDNTIPTSKAVKDYVDSNVWWWTLNDLSDAKTNSKSVFVWNRSWENNATTWYNNTAIWYNSLINNITWSYNTVVWYSAWYRNRLWNKNVFLWYQAWYSERDSNKLYIDNSSTSRPLIKWDFSTNDITINGDLEVKWEITIDWIPIEKKIEIDPTWHNVINNNYNAWNWNKNAWTRNFTVPRWKVVTAIRLSWTSDDWWICFIYSSNKLAFAITNKAYITNILVTGNIRWTARNSWSWNMKTQIFTIKSLSWLHSLWVQNYNDNFWYNVNSSIKYLEEWDTIRMWQRYNDWQWSYFNKCKMDVQYWKFYY